MTACSECGRTGMELARGLCKTKCYNRAWRHGLFDPRRRSPNADYKELAERYWLMQDGTEPQRVLADRLGVELHTLVRALHAERRGFFRTDHEDDYDYA